MLELKKIVFPRYCFKEKNEDEALVILFLRVCNCIALFEPCRWLLTSYNTLKTRQLCMLLLCLQPDTGIIDYDHLEDLASRFKPKIIIAGTSAYSRNIDYVRFRQVSSVLRAVATGLAWFQQDQLLDQWPNFERENSTLWFNGTGVVRTWSGMLHEQGLVKYSNIADLQHTWRLSVYHREKLRDRLALAVWNVGRFSDIWWQRDCSAVCRGQQDE